MSHSPIDCCLIDPIDQKLQAKERERMIDDRTEFLSPILFSSSLDNRLFIYFKTRYIAISFLLFCSYSCPASLCLNWIECKWPITPQRQENKQPNNKCNEISYQATESPSPALETSKARTSTCMSSSSTNWVFQKRNPFITFHFV